ncbi:hypothetical protein DL765_010105 [Monosporascus sp. GIB2]|nr:hypothetical protein DL765_010105 [Monosporascus sp. GIB2]
MATPTGKPPDTPAVAPAALDGDAPEFRAPKKPSGPVTPSRLRQVLLADIASSPSQAANSDFTFFSPLKGKGKNGNTDSANGTKRPRIEDGTHEESTQDTARQRIATTECHDHVAQIVANDRRMYEAKMRLFEECTAAVDKTLERAGTELYAHAKGFGTFFAKCLTAWLENGTVPEAKTAYTTAATFRCSSVNFSNTDLWGFRIRFSKPFVSFKTSHLYIFLLKMAGSFWQA